MKNQFSYKGWALDGSLKLGLLPRMEYDGLNSILRLPISQHKKFNKDVLVEISVTVKRIKK
jgi:hypothetical protein